MMMNHFCTILFINSEGALKVGHSAADEFVKMDPFGVGMALIAMSIVFSVLAVVYLIFKYISKTYLFFQIRKIKRQENNKIVEVTPEAVEAEVTAAIAMALHLYRSRQHDMESLKMTIQKVSKMYSPWSSKLYMLTQTPKK